MNWFVPLVLLLLVPVPGYAFNPFVATGIDRISNAVVPLDLPFTDQAGAKVTLRQLAQGKPILLAPVLHDCPNICSVTLAGLAQAIREQQYQPGQDFTLVAFGIDPAEGAEKAAAEQVKLHHDFPDVQPTYSLTGNAQNIAAVTKSLGYRYAWDEQIGQYAHLAAVAVLTSDGRLARWLYGLSPAPKDLRLALTEAGEGRIGSWTDQVLLLCYHYDPQTGQYGPVIWTILRIAGAITAATLLAMIGYAVLREQRAKAAGR